MFREICGMYEVLRYYAKFGSNSFYEPFHIDNLCNFTANIGKYFLAKNLVTLNVADLRIMSFLVKILQAFSLYKDF